MGQVFEAEDGAVVEVQPDARHRTVALHVEDQVAALGPDTADELADALRAAARSMRAGMAWGEHR